jgi:hypothetical protein
MAPRPASPRLPFDSESSVRVRSPESLLQPRAASPRPVKPAAPPHRPNPTKPAALPPSRVPPAAAVVSAPAKPAVAAVSVPALSTAVAAAAPVRSGPPPLPTTAVLTAPVISKGPPPLPAVVSAEPAHNPFLPLAFPPPSAESPSFALPTTVAKPAAPAFTALPQVGAPKAVAPQTTATSQLAPAPRVYLSEDLPDLFDGRARNRRAIMVVIGVALLVLLGAVASAIASHYRPV